MNVGLLGTGEMGQAVGKTLKANGVRVSVSKYLRRKRTETNAVTPAQTAPTIAWGSPAA